MELDPQVKALASAIKKQESGGSKDPYNAKGASGEHGAYQFMPDTWKSWAGTHLGDANAPMTMENQNKVAYNQIKSWKDKGYNPAQIAAAWNAGEGSLKNDSWKTLKGVNKLGVAYDTPTYVSNVSKYYQELKGNTPEVLKNTNLTPEGVDLSSIPSTQTTEKRVISPIVQAIGGGVYDPAAQIGMEAANRVIGPTANALGYDYEQVKSLPSFANLTGDKTAPRATAPSYDAQGNQVSLGTEAEKTLGAAGMTALNLATGGKGAAVKEGLQGIGKYAIGKTGGPISSVLKAGVKEVPMGAGYGATSAMSEGGDTGDVLAGTAVGSGLAFLGGSALKGATNQLAKKQGITTTLVNDLDQAVQSGDDAQIKAITESEAYKKLITANKYDEKGLQDSIKKVRDDIDAGIDNSTGVSKLTRSEKAESLTDDGITAMLEHSVSSNNPIYDTKLNLENKANELMDSALNPVLDKVRAEKLPLASLDRKNLIDDFNTNLDKTYLADKDKESIKAYVKDLIESQNKGNMFGVVDAGIIRRNANFDFVNPKNKGVVGRLLGNTMRDALATAEKNTTDPAAKAIISHINAVNAEYSRLMKGVDVVDLMARFPGQKSSELLNKAAGFLAAGSTGNNPLAYLGAHKVVNAAQRAMIRSKNGKIFGDITAKAGPLTSSELIGNAKRILGNVESISAGNKAAQAAVTQSAANSAKRDSAVSQLLKTISPKRDSELPVIKAGSSKSKYSRTDKSLPTIRGMAKPEAIAALGGISATAMGAYNKMQEGTKYQREADTPEEPFMKPVVNEQAVEDQKKGIIDGVDISKYATDPEHEVKVRAIHSKMPEMATSTDAQSYIDNMKDKYGHKIKVTGDMVYKAAKEYGVSMKLMMALMQNDSMFGTTGKGKNSNNPGNIGNDDNGNMIYYPTMSEGVAAVARQLARFKGDKTKAGTGKLVMAK